MKVLKSHACYKGVTEFWEHDSKVTKTSMKFATHRPKNIKGAVIWLSGLSCNEENFITKAGSQRLLEELGLMVICPDTSPRGLNLPNEHEAYDFGSGAGFYLDATTEGYKDYYRMGSYINEELYDLANATFNLNGNMSLMGHSMGGHGALILGLKNPDKYKSLSAFAPITNPLNCEWGKKAFKGYLGSDESTWAPYDACKIIESGRKHPQEILVDQGLSDQFYPQQLLTKNFEAACKKAGQALKVNYRDGFDHSYYFIATFLENHLRHHGKFL